MTNTKANQEQGYFNTALVPVMREAVSTVQMILFKVLKDSIHARYADQVEPHHTHLAGAVINNLFGTQPMDASVTVFAAENRDQVERELRQLADHLEALIPVLTDALRMQTICDNQEGIHSIPSLLMAKALGILQEQRPLPLPSTFMIQVRSLAADYGLIEPMNSAPPPAGAPA